jgi:hypothetical protein
VCCRVHTLVSLQEDKKILKAAEGMDLADVDADEVEWGTDLSEAAQAARAAEMVPEKLKALVELDGIAVGVPAASEATTSTASATSTTSSTSVSTTTRDSAKAEAVSVGVAMTLLYVGEIVRCELPWQRHLLM